MKTILLMVVLLTQACAHRTGATYTGNGDAGGGSTLLSKWSETIVGTDLEGAELGPTGYRIAKQNQSTVANKVVTVGGQAIAGYIGADVIKSVTNSNNAVTVSESGNALKATQAKEATKVAKDANATSVKIFEAEAAAIPKP